MLYYLSSDILSIDSIKSSLRAFSLLGSRKIGLSWPFGGEELALQSPVDHDVFAVLDVFGQPWPDDVHIGREDESDVALAWSEGVFGRHSEPGCLAQAVGHAWGWAGSSAAAESHRAFVRIRGGVDPDSESKVDPMASLFFATEVGEALMAVPGVLAMFCPAGEALRGRELVASLLDRSRQGGPPPLELWSNVRFFRILDADGWFLMDTVGMAQLDAIDHEAVFYCEGYDRGDVDAFLREASLRSLGGDRPDQEQPGPGCVSWRGTIREAAAVEPARPVVRWLPADGRAYPGAGA